MARLTLEIPKAFGKALLAEQVQEFVIQAMAQAWDDCVISLCSEGCLSDREKDYYIKNNPYKVR